MKVFYLQLTFKFLCDGGDKIKMPNLEKKQLVVNEIKEKLNGAVSVVLLNVEGLNTQQDSELRKKMSESEISYKVYKNTMLHFAFKDTSFENLNEFLNGPTRVAISYKNSTEALRIISQMKLGNFEFKAAMIDGDFYAADQLKVIAELPSREELLARFLRSIKAPIVKFAYIIKTVSDSQNNIQI